MYVCRWISSWVVVVIDPSVLFNAPFPPPPNTPHPKKRKRSYLPELPLEVGDVLVGGDPRVRARVDGVLLRGQPEGVPALCCDASRIACVVRLVGWVRGFE